MCIHGVVEVGGLRFHCRKIVLLEVSLCLPGFLRRIG